MEENIINIIEIVNQFYENNENFKSLKKVCEQEKAQIKEYILTNNISNNTIETNIAKATVTEVTKQTFKEQELIEFLKPLEIPGLIEYKPIINMEILQDSLYHNNINAEDIKPYMVEDITYRLDIKKSKKIIKE